MDLTQLTRAQLAQALSNGGYTDDGAQLSAHAFSGRFTPSGEAVYTVLFKDRGGETVDGKLYISQAADGTLMAEY